MSSLCDYFVGEPIRHDVGDTTAMKRIIFLSVFLFFVSISYAQEDAVFYKHEIRASFGPSLISNAWIRDGTIHSNVSVAYFYRPVKWFWIGGNIVNIFGTKIYYRWREYSVDGNFKDFSKSKTKYCAVIAPEIRFSYNNDKDVFFYSALSGGFAWEDGYSNMWQKYPKKWGYYQITFWGFSSNFGKNKNIFTGCELGVGCKGLFSMNGGYRL